VAGTATVPDRSCPEITERRSTSCRLFDPDRDSAFDDPNEDDCDPDGNRARGGDAGQYGAGARAEEKESVGENAERDRNDEHKREQAGTTVATTSDVTRGCGIAGVAIDSPHRHRELRGASNHSPQGSTASDADVSDSNPLHAHSLDARNNEDEEPPT
jgi:hypothetical protein